MIDLNKIVSIDIETECGKDCGLTPSKCRSEGHALVPHENKITCIGYHNKDGTLQGVMRGHNMQKEFKELVAYMKSKNLIALGHNFSFDMKVISYHFYNYKGPDRTFWGHDTQALAYVMTEKIPESWLKAYEQERLTLNKTLPRGVSHRRAGPHSLKTLAPYFLNVPKFWEDPQNHDNDEYVLKDVEYTFKLFEILCGRASKQELDFYLSKQMPWARELIEAEIKGVKTNTKLMRTNRAHHERAALKAYRKVKKNWNLSEEFNLNSPKQLLGLLRDDLGYKTENFDGKQSTDKEVLNRLATTHPDVKDLLTYRKHMKLANTYYPSYERFQAEDGRIHCSFNANVTRTGRLSSSFPNLQNQPESTREIFESDPEKSFIIRDLSGVEPVLIAYYTLDENLLDIVLDPQKNFHNAVTPLIFPYVDCDNKNVKTLFKAERDVTKTADLAIFYGSGARRLHTIMYKAGFTGYTEDDCRKIVRRLREYFKGVWHFKLQLDELLSSGQTIYNLLGRPIRIQNKDDVYMKGFNRLIQGSGSDIVLNAIKTYNDSCRSRGIDSQALITVHDEIIAQAPDDKLEECERLLISSMVDGVNLTRSGNKIKLETEGTISKTWVK